MAHGNITPVYGLWLKENLSLYNFNSEEAKRLEENLRNLDTDKAESSRELIELYTKFLNMFCNSMHSVALGINEKGITSTKMKAYLVENEYGVMTPIGLMEDSKKKAEYNVEGSAIPALQKQSEMDEDIKSFNNQNNAGISSCNTYSETKTPKKNIILISLLLIIAAYIGMLANMNVIMADMNIIYLSFFWGGIAVVILVFTALALREMNSYWQWRNYKQKIIWLERYLENINKNKSETAEIVTNTTIAIKTAISSDSQDLSVQAISLPKYQSSIENKKAAILNMIRNYKKRYRCIYLWELLVLSVLNVFLFYGIDQWNYREINSLGRMVINQEETQDIPEEAVTEAPAEKTVSYNKIAAMSGEATSELTGKKTGKKYGIEYTMDGDITTCWQEGAKGDGIGESLIYHFDGEYPFMKLIIWNGKVESQKKYDENNRINEMEITCYRDDIKVFNKTVTLDDEYSDKGKTIYLREKEAINCNRIEFKIISIHQGSKYHDTCLTDIEFYEGVY